MPAIHPSSPTVRTHAFDTSGSITPELCADVIVGLNEWLIAASLPEQEWCEDCALDVDVEPGMPRDVFSRETVTITPPAAKWDPSWGPGPQYDIAHLNCGHHIVTTVR